jgi:lysozyme
VRISAEGVALVQRFEGKHDGDLSTPLLEPMRDPVGIPTLGWGSIYGLDRRRVTMEHRAITDEEATGLLRRDLRRAENAVTRLIKVALGQDQFDALVSFTYNVGSGNLLASTLRRMVNRGDFEGAEAEFPKWRKSKGVILAGLVRRRKAERRLFADV